MKRRGISFECNRLTGKGFNTHFMLPYCASLFRIKNPVFNKLRLMLYKLIQNNLSHFFVIFSVFVP
jgi:hypothetical protein